MPCMKKPMLIERWILLQIRSHVESDVISNMHNNGVVRVSMVPLIMNAHWCGNFDNDVLGTYAEDRSQLAEHSIGNRTFPFPAIEPKALPSLQPMARERFCLCCAI